MSAFDKAKYLADNRAFTKAKNILKIKFNQIITKCLQTTFVGALSIFENEFGDLWGQGQDKLTPEQKQMRKRWNKVRTAIFDLGNNQISFTNKQLNIFYDKYDQEITKKETQWQREI